MSEPTDLIDLIVNETKRTLNEMSGTEDLERRRAQSEIVNNLCESMAVFFDVASQAMDFEDLPDFDDDEEWETEEDAKPES